MPSLCDDLLFWNGAYAEFARIPARVVTQEPAAHADGLDFREAAMMEPLACVIRGVEESWIGRGQSVAVIGTGPIGLMFVALARMRGAHVDRGRAAPAAPGQGAGDGRREAVAVSREGVDLAELLRERSPDGRGADVVIEAVGPARDLGGRGARSAQGRRGAALRRLSGGHARSASTRSSSTTRS